MTRGVLLGMALVLVWRWVARRAWQRWRAFDGLPAELRRRAY